MHVPSSTLSPPAVYCGNIPVIEHALVNGVTSFHLAGWVDYQCEEGYHLSTDQKITCQDNGLWETTNGDILECLRKYQWPKTLAGDVHERCHFARLMNDHVFTFPRYAADVCPDVTTPDNAEQEVTNEVTPGELTYGTVVAFTCNTGYQMTEGSPLIYCMPGGVWSDPTDPVCSREYLHDEILPCL